MHATFSNKCHSFSFRNVISVKGMIVYLRIWLILLSHSSAIKFITFHLIEVTNTCNRLIMRNRLLEIFVTLTSFGTYVVKMVHASSTNVYGYSSLTSFWQTHRMLMGLKWQSVRLHGSHMDWNTWKNEKTFSSQGKVREFYPKYWKKLGNFSQFMFLLFSLTF